jgi:ABC-type dipeptide/oligopeptide/nickel transport system permease subunit
LGVCRRHLLLLALPGLLNWALRTAGTALILFSVLDFYDASLHGHAASSWGATMRAHYDDLLEHPALALGPALWIALWSLSFRLLSRAFRIETPQNRTPTFVP